MAGVLVVRVFEDLSGVPVLLVAVDLLVLGFHHVAGLLPEADSGVLALLLGGASDHAVVDLELLQGRVEEGAGLLLFHAGPVGGSDVGVVVLSQGARVEALKLVFVKEEDLARLDEHVGLFVGKVQVKVAVRREAVEVGEAKAVFRLSERVSEKDDLPSGLSFFQDW